MGTGLESVDWAEAVGHLVGQGWTRLQGQVTGRTCTRLLGAAPPTWIDTPEHQMGQVREAGVSSGMVLADSSSDVRSFAERIREGVNSALPPGVAELPPFTDVQWGRARDTGAQFITAHRDPLRVGGVIAITTLFGSAPFRIWHDGADPRGSESQLPSTAWETADGDLVLIAGNGWPRPQVRCPVHEVGSPPGGERMIMTLRHNTAGAGADFFGS